MTSPKRKRTPQDNTDPRILSVPALWRKSKTGFSQTILNLQFTHKIRFTATNHPH
jgi:hypothetical protein